MGPSWACNPKKGSSGSRPRPPRIPTVARPTASFMLSTETCIVVVSHVGDNCSTLVTRNTSLPSSRTNLPVNLTLLPAEYFSRSSSSLTLPR